MSIPIKYPVAKPNLMGNESKYLAELIKDNEVSHKGRFVKRFEEEFAEYIGVKYALTCSSGTTALHLALAALRIGLGDEVIIPEMTMIATGWAVKYTGATPVFANCDDRMLIDCEDIKKKITPKTKAIMPVHLYGRVCDMEEIKKIAYENNLYVIEDCAEAHGAFAGYKDCKQMVGSIGDIGCFSLFGNKIITSGEGGIITTNDERVYKQMEHLRGMAFDVNHSFIHPKMGFNYRMSNLQAALACAQLEKMEKFLFKRREIQAWYISELEGNPNIEIVERYWDDNEVLWMFDILIKNLNHSDVSRVIEKLAEKGIESRRLFCPMSFQPSLGDESSNIEAAVLWDKFYRRGLYLPTYFDLEREDVRYICRELKQIIAN